MSGDTRDRPAPPLVLGITVGNLGGALVTFSYFNFIDLRGHSEWSAMPSACRRPWRSSAICSRV